jgi:hypothetical protein
MEYKRLTGRDKADALKELEYIGFYSERYIRLAELEDMIEAGRLVEHKFKPQDIVYVPILEDKKVYKMKVYMVQYGAEVGVCGIIKDIGQFVTTEDNCFFDEEAANNRLQDMIAVAENND